MHRVRGQGIGLSLEVSLMGRQRQLAALAATAILVLGCQQDANSKSPVATANSASPPPTPPPPLKAEPHYTKFKVTSAKPSDVEASLHAGWKVVNCSVAIRENAEYRGGPSIVAEHCYLEGDEQAADAVDAGAR